MGGAAEPAIIADEEFASPDRPIRAVPRAVECHADDRFIQTMLGHATGHVGMMVLHGQAAALPSMPPADEHNCVDA